MALTPTAQREKTLVALSSVGAAIGLTSLKITVALLTGSLGLLAEAAHSGLDLVAALMTFFAVRVADRPADADHNYGHEKVENISALMEAILLLMTAAWVTYEAIRRLCFHEGSIEINIWAFVVMGISVGVDVTRSRALLRVARKLGSQALEADALHFSTDIWSSVVVIIGLVVVFMVQRFHLPDWLAQADAVAALGVSAIVIWVSIRLARETIDALIDRAPGTLPTHLYQQLSLIKTITQIRRIRIRRTGNKFFADIIIAAPRILTFEQIHTLTEQVELVVQEKVLEFTPQGEIDAVVHVEPVATPSESITDLIHYLAERQGVHAHDIHVREVSGKLEADFDLEVHADMDLRTAHDLATHLEQAVLQSNRNLRRVTTHLEAPNTHIVPRQEVTDHYQTMTRQICQIADGIAGQGSAHDIRLYRPNKVLLELKGEAKASPPELDLVLHTIFAAQAPLSQVHVEAEEIKRALRQAYPNLNSVTIHTEPPE
ncbi:cation diffusion facilitator family transporter [Tengunoibacter tsumagoiensis]|uniref:Cation transporter n=1 Tax=Tengunoibacter tsumagoiensis TaxID=2014871 RepID=A0A402A0S6_9CHLR|nr:cation diffusion facilitator family transporter [Tengunoibacter tsumagoiensis]GCE12714.1 cation transporter [Tengunoibacter tsumagoiensis]